MNKHKKAFHWGITSVIISSVLITGIACKNGDSSQKEKNESNKQEIMEATDEFLLQGGVSQYKIVYPADADNNEQVAVSDLQNVFKEATRCILPTVKDNEITTFDENSKYIFVGDNSFAKELNVVPSQTEYGLAGYVIKTVNDSIFITGAVSTATQFGVYRFLEYILDYDYFYKDAYYVNKGVADIPFMKYDVSIIPDIEYNSVGYGFISSSTELARFSMLTAPVTGVKQGATGHSSLLWMPLETYCNPDDPENYHPKWYMEGADPSQFCYTARGDKAEYDLMVQTAAEVMKNLMRTDSTAHFFDFSMTDNFVWCGCEECLRISKKYGALAAGVVLFLNDMTQMVEDWFATEEGSAYEREFYVQFYAYHNILAAPVFYDDSKDTFSVGGDEIFCNKHVIPKVADEWADYTTSVTTNQNYELWLALKGWAYLSEHTFTYYYNARYHDLLSPLDTFNNMQELYQFSKENNCQGVYQLGSVGQQGHPTGWGALKIYLMSKLGVDVNCNVEKYMDKFFGYAFQDAADTMRKLFEEWRFLEEYNSQTFPEYATRKSHYNEIRKAQYFPKNILLRWIEYTSTALEEIEYLKIVDPALYERTRTFIVGERVGYVYLYYSIYQVEIPAAQLRQVKDLLIDDILTCGSTKYASGMDMDEFIETLRGD